MANQAGRISGPLLKSNLLRNGVDLAFEDDLLYLDVNNNRIGVKNSSPGYEVDITGTIAATSVRAGEVSIDDIFIDNNSISSTNGSINFAPNTASDFINFNGNVEVTGNLHATGNITADGDLTLGDADTDTVSFAADIGSNFIPDLDGQYDLGSSIKRWKSLYVSGQTIFLGSLQLKDDSGVFSVTGVNGSKLDFTARDIFARNLNATQLNTDSIEINDNYITTVDSDADLELRANGAGNLLLTSALQANADVTINANLEVIGNGNFSEITVEDIKINGNVISTTNSDSDLELRTSGTGTIVASATRITNVANPEQEQDAATKIYVDNSTSSISGDDLTIGAPTDGSYTDGAVQILDITTTVSNAVDGLNEALNNVRNNTFVRTVTFDGSPLAGGAGIEVTLNISFDGNPDRYEIDWGDGNSDDTTDSTPSHVYASNVGSPFTVTVRAYNSNGSGTGSEASFLREDYVIVYTADPVVDFVAYDALTDGNIVTFWDDGDSVYFENTTTHCDGSTAQWTWSWNDGSADDVVANTDAGGVDGARIAHTFTSQAEADVSRTVTLTLDTHNTADPTVIPTNDADTFRIYDDHTPEVGLDITTGINEESTSGLPVTFTNNTENTVGSFATFGIQYLYTFGDGSTQTVNAGSGSAGDIDNSILHTYTLTATEQANGTPRDYTGNLQLISNHSASPFISTNFTVHVEPDVRANIAGTAITQSDRTGDNQFSLYDGVDYNGNNRAIVTTTNTSQNADDYVYAWGDSSADDTVTEDGASPGTIASALTHDYTGEAIGNKTFTFTANGTPDITLQNDTEQLIFDLKSIPSAPAGLSSKTLELTTPDTATNGKLAAGFADNSASNPLSAGDSLESSTARSYTTGTIETAVVSNVYDGLSGTLTAVINGSGVGNTSFSTALNENGTFGSLIVSDQRDAHDTISSSIYPTGFYQTFDAKVSHALTSYTLGVNDLRLEHNETGNTNYVAIVRDDITGAPVLSLGTLSETTGNYRYISGIPYYDTGSVITISGTTVDNFIGQVYRDTNDVLLVASGTNVEGTTGSSISTQTYSYSDIDGATTFLTSGIPNANTGNGTPYALGDIDINITSANVISIEDLTFTINNVTNSAGSDTTSTLVQVHTSNPTGLVETAIPVSDSLGNGTHTDDGVRVADFTADTTDTPSFNGATNFYTNNPFTGGITVQGTKEATVRLGLLSHNTNNYSTGYLPVGPDRSGDTGTQYFTFAFRRQVVANFEISLDSDTGIAGLWIAAPGTAIDNASGLNGWLDSGIQYAGSGVPGSNTGAGGNGADGCASLGVDIIPTDTAVNSSFTLTLGSENMSNATGNVVLVRIGLTSGQSVNSVSIS